MTDSLWRPMDSAPRDGTEILVWCDFDSLKCAIVLSFGDNEQNPDWPWWDWDCKGIHKSVPVCWMPVPVGPSGQTSK